MIGTIVLGARDPEMDAIGRLALNSRLNVIWAAKGGKPVAYDQMYVADYPVPALGQLWVECSPPEGKAGLDFVDHHNPGDPGFERPPSEFWEASSFGQVWKRLHPDMTPPEALRVVAATDHCPHAAYSGECRDIDAGSVVAFAAEQIALSGDRTVKDVLRDVYRWIHKFRTLSTKKVSGTEFYYHDQPLTDAGQWLILREAALWHGISVISQVPTGHDIWVKVAGHTTPKFIRAFMAGQVVTEPMTRIYGDAHRGYAGGLLTPAAS